MTKRQYKIGIQRQQRQLLPPSVEEYVSKDNPVRAIDTYVDSLDLEALGFQNTASQETMRGQPAYPPGALLKLYLYGYLHRTRSSRRLEAECVRNLEVIWLLEGLRPGYKTIADFRRNNLKALKAVNADFVQLCKELKLFGAELVSIDGSFFRGNVSKDSIYTEEKLKKSLHKLETSINEYMQALDQNDHQENDLPGHSDCELAAKLEQLRQRQQLQQKRLQKLTDGGLKQLAEVDEDARLLSKNGQSVAGYNVQTVVDAKHKLLVVSEATQDGNDENQLEPMAKKAKEVLEAENLEACADSGYFNATGILNCEASRITPYVPEPDRTTQPGKQGRFGREQFQYDAQENAYRCPARQLLHYSSTQNKRGRSNLIYRSSKSVCAQCPLQSQCVPAKSGFRTITRWEHEDVLIGHRERMAAKGREMMLKRCSLSEHPFGTLKLWCGWTHFLLRGLKNVQAELSLWMLGYNFRRVLTILGLEEFRVVCLRRAGMLQQSC